MKHHFWKENGDKILTGLLIAAGAIFLFFVFMKIGPLFGSLRHLVHIIAPIVSGAVIAYLVAPICNAYERGLYSGMKRLKMFRKDTTRQKVSGALAVAGSMLTLIAVIVLFLVMILPQLWQSIVSMFNSISVYTDNIITLTKNLFAEHSWLEGSLVKFWESAESYITNFFQTKILPNVDVWITNLSTGVSQTIVFLYNISIGMIVAVYMLASRRRFAAQGIKFLYAVLPARQAGMVLGRVRFADRVFGKFISGKIVESLIIGAIAMVGTYILKMPYAVLISVVIGLTNIIPFFGPIIGAIPCIFITLIVDPLKALYLTIFIVILQQVDGNIIGPKIMGKSTGLSGFWVLFSILLFGGLFGVLGMILGMPIFAIIYSMVSDWVSSRLQKKHLPSETESYMNFVENEAAEDVSYLD